MQRIRRPLLQRRALEKAVGGRSHFKVSLSLVFVLWGILLLNLWIICVDGYEDVCVEHPIGLSTWNEAKLEHGKCFDSVDENLSKEAGFVYSDLSSCRASAEKRGSLDKLLASEHSGSGVKFENNAPKIDRLSCSVPLGLNEFKSKAFSSKSKSGCGQAAGVIHRLEPGGQEYNYASASKGAKVLAFNKEAKGATDILGRDKDKYLRNPCSAEEKFVVIELSEETLVKTIEIANFEHYSSNLKEFELLGSLVYPIDVWVRLGNFTAENVKHAQRFTLQEPKWVRYLKLNLLTHYGSEFYCTVSVVEVYGVDAVERMLEDLITVQGNIIASEDGNGIYKPSYPHSEPTQGDDIYRDVHKETEADSSVENSNAEHEVVKNKIPYPAEEIHHQQVGRMPGDSVLKILMQKVRSLDSSLSIFEQYMEELNSRYGNIFKEFDTDLGKRERILDEIRSDIKSLLNSQNAIAKDLGDLIFWKALVSTWLNDLLRDNLVLRSNVEMVQENQISMESKCVVVFLISLIFGFLSAVKLFADMLLSVYKAFSVQRTEESRKFCWSSSSWLFMLSSCSMIILVLSL